MTSICIGIPLYEEPGQLGRTLETLWANTPKPFEILLLPDGPDDSMLSELSHLAHLPQSPSPRPLGTAACFNRLAASSQADLVVLLESGCVVGTGWLQTMLAVLEADPSHGLVGPSTNHCWNQQSLAQHGVIHPSTFSTASTLADVNRVSHTIMQRFGTSFHRLEPLHSLADFCYAVRRQVIDAVGFADENYGLGPCWEMDYNIRAARAGFRGVWACGSYVQRSPFSSRRAVEETQLFEASKRRYQDKFCALHLRKETTTYEPHCKGEECEHFAPADLLQIYQASPAAGQAPQRTVPFTVQTDSPLVSCIMATRDRPAYVLQSIRYFQRQDYPNRELLILDDDIGPDLSSVVESDSRLRYFRVPGKMSIGAKRNRGCELARGTFITQWDDDDWYGATRLSAQLEPLLSGAAQISALSAGVFFDLSRWQFWRISADLHRRMFVGDVHGGTLVFHRSLFDRGVRYPDRSIAEDAWFLWHATQRGAQVKKVRGDDLFVYVRHGGSSWEFRCGEFLDPSGWRRVEAPGLLQADIEFYRELCPQEPEIGPASEPLVSCIMPTANRRKFVPHAIQCFQTQDYRNCELLVIDDGTDSIADLIPDDRRISYVQLDTHPSLGGKRNLGCEMARGEYIMHWDDDDWATPSRIATQMRAMIAHPEIDICGLDRLYFYDPSRNEAWFYAHPPGSRAWLAGNTLCYRKSLWRKQPFPEINEGEDTLFVWSLSERQMLPLRNPNFFVATIHAQNTSPKQTATPGWNRVSQEEIARVFGSDAQSGKQGQDVGV
jgi:glycosyltransferase involved in cell wall biosynthesis